MSAKQSRQRPQGTGACAGAGGCNASSLRFSLPANWRQLVGIGVPSLNICCATTIKYSITELIGSSCREGARAGSGTRHKTQSTIPWLA
jgi:hypothetical protein